MDSFEELRRLFASAARVLSTAKAGSRLGGADGVGKGGRSQSFSLRRWRVKTADVALAIGLVGTIALTAALRFGTIAQMMPYPYHVDEPYLTVPAANMIKTGDLNPHFFNYPSLPIYLTAAGIAVGFISACSHLELSEVAQIGSVEFPYFSNPRVLWPAKALFALLSVLGLALLGVFAARATSSPVQLLLVPLVVGVSRHYFDMSCTYLNVDVVGTFWIVCVYLSLQRALDWGVTIGRVASMGVLCGFSIACKYNLVPVVAPCLMVVAAKSSTRMRDTAVLWAATALAFVLCVPYSLLDLSSFLNDVGYEVFHYRAGHPGADISPGWAQLWAYLGDVVEDYGTWSVLPAALGSVHLFLRNWKRALLYLTFPALLLLLVSAQKVHFPRNITAVFVVYGLLCALGIHFLFGLLDRVRRGAAERIGPLSGRIAQWGLTVAVLLVCLPLERPARWAKQPDDSREMAADWMLANLSKGATLVVPRELAMKTDRLADAFNVVGVSLAAVNSVDSLLGRGPGDSLFMLMPEWGFDRRFAADPGVVGRLRRFEGMVDTVAVFGDNRVLLNYSQYAPSGNPRFVVGRVGRRGGGPTGSPPIPQGEL